MAPTVSCLSKYSTNTFLALPPELRLKMYTLLLVPGSQDTLYIRNENPSDYEKRKRQLNRQPLRRVSYKILVDRDRYELEETTFRLLVNPGLHPQILGTNRQIHDEAAHVLYGSHCFDFSVHIESILPFLSALTTPALAAIKNISLGQPVYLLPKDYDREQWEAACIFMANTLELQQLTLIVHSGRLDQPLSSTARDAFTRLNFESGLTDLDCLDWAKQLLRIKGLRVLNVEPRWRTRGKPCTDLEIFYLNFSASLKAGFEDFLHGHMVARGA